MTHHRLGSNVAFSVANVVVVVGVSLLSVPILIDHLGLAGYGVWTLAQTLVIYVTSAELGFGPALARFTSVRRGDSAATRQALVGALGLYAAGGTIVVLAFHLSAGPLVDLFDIPGRFQEDAESTVRLMGWVSALALGAGALGHVLTGLERFRAFTSTNAVGSAVFIVALIIGFSDGARLQDAGRAALLQWATVTILRISVLHEIVRARGRWLPERGLVRELVSFSAKLQAATLATLLNTQTDRVIVGVVASTRTLGQVGIATQVGEAARFLAYAAFSPLAARMAVRYGEGGETALRQELDGARLAWKTGVIGGIALGVGLAYPAIEAWVGPGHGDAAAYAALLLAAYGIGLLPSPSFAYLRAAGRPGLEGVFGAVTVGVNIIATVPLGVLFGAPGVVGATTLAYIASTAWVSLRVARIVPESASRPGSTGRLVGCAAIAAGIAYSAGMMINAVLPRPFELLVLAPMALIVFAGYVSAASRTSPMQAVARVRSDARARFSEGRR